MKLQVTIENLLSGLPYPGLFLLLWKVLENIWEVSCASLRQNSKATFFNNKHKKSGT